MTAEIVWEGSTLCRTLWWGMVFAAEYDTIRIFRRIVNIICLLSWFLRIWHTGYMYQ